jgi:hypothetical protein
VVVICAISKIFKARTEGALSSGGAYDRKKLAGAAKEALSTFSRISVDQKNFPGSKKGK